MVGKSGVSRRSSPLYCTVLPKTQLLISYLLVILSMSRQSMSGGLVLYLNYQISFGTGSRA
jgi:hypothetical protein